MERNGKSATLEYDGASKGNPGRSGAGYVLRDESGKVEKRGHEGLGNTTNNVAEFSGLIRGMKAALKHGYTDIRVQGDSELVSKQVQGEWRVRSPNLIPLYNQARELKRQFDSFEIIHVPRKYNSEADAQANYGVRLRDGEVIEEDYYYY